MFCILDSRRGLIGTCTGFSYSVRCNGGKSQDLEMTIVGCDNPSFFPYNQDLILAGTSYWGSTPQFFAFRASAVESARSLGRADITVIARALDFGSPGEQNYECAMAIVNHELRKQPEMNMSNWFDMMEAVRGDS